MRKRRPPVIECPPELTVFRAADWPAPSRLHSWQDWMHARADFADAHAIDFDAIPYEVTPSEWSAVLEAVSA